ncbi:HPr kinase/phosphatase C-terminal domain-containing protein, partial [Mycobacterium tuberculosis]|nr:HPr kinase/phosphatase C-terminal domain-containing protein [Mycobacterium tuberculosis]
IHASAVVLGDAGILVRGASGSGKSTLVLDLLEDARRDGIAAALVGDDRVALATEAGRLIAKAVPRLKGQVEVRGLGIVAVPAADQVPIRLVVDIGAEPAERLPAPETRVTTVLGVTVARLYLCQREPRAARLVRLALGLAAPPAPVAPASRAGAAGAE